MHRLWLWTLSVRPRLWRLRHQPPPTPEPETDWRWSKGWTAAQIWISLVVVLRINICFVFLSLISYDQNRFRFSSSLGIGLCSDVSLGLMNVTEAVSDSAFYIRCSPHFDKFRVRGTHLCIQLGDPYTQIFGIHQANVYCRDWESMFVHIFPPQV